MSNIKGNHPRSFTPNPRELPQSNMQSDKSKRGNHESLYERILSRGYPPVGKKVSNNALSKRAKSPRRVSKENHKPAENMSRQHPSSKNLQKPEKLKERNGSVGRIEMQMRDEKQKFRNLKENYNAKSGNIIMDNFYRNCQDSIYVDMFNANEELKKLMSNEESPERKYKQKDANYYSVIENNRYDQRERSPYGENNQNKSRYILQERINTEEQYSSNGNGQANNTFGYNNGYWKYKKLMKSLESFESNSRKDGDHDGANQQRIPVISIKYDLNVPEYPRSSYNQNSHNESNHSNKSFNSNNFSYFEKPNYRNEKQDHVRKLLLHTPKSKDTSANKSTNVTSLLNENHGNSIQQYDSIFHPLFDERKSFNGKVTPQRYTTTSILGENSASQIGKSNQTSYDKAHGDSSSYYSKSNFDAVNLNRDSLLSSISKCDNFGIEAKKTTDNHLIKPEESTNIAPAMSQDPIPSENVIMIKGTIPSLPIKSSAGSDSNRITVKLDSDVIENASQRSNYEYRYQPNRDVDKIIEKSSQNRRRLNLSVRRSRSTLVKRDDVLTTEISASDDNNKNQPQHAPALDAIKTKLGRITNSSNSQLGENTEISTSKDTPHSITSNSEYNSLQSLSVNSNERRKATDWQPNMPKINQPSNSGYFMPSIEKQNKVVEDNKSHYPPAIKTSYSLDSNRQISRTESLAPEKNVVQAGSHISVAELLSAADQSQQFLNNKFSHRSIQNRPSYTVGQHNQSVNISTYSNSTEYIKTEQDPQRSEHFSRHRGSMQLNLHALVRSKSESEMKKHSNYSKEGKKEFLSALKNFSESFVRSTKNYLTNKLSLSDARLKCSCSSNLGKDDTCELAMKWLLTQYKPSELPYLKDVYLKLQSENDFDVRNRKQIKLDISRTFPETNFYSAAGGGQHELQRVLECFARYDPQIGNSHPLPLILIVFIFVRIRARDEFHCWQFPLSCRGIHCFLATRDDIRKV